MILRIRSRDGTDRITVPDAASATVGDLQRLIAARVTVPVPLQRLSLDPALLLPPAASAAALPRLLSDPAARLASLNLPNGSFVYLSYPPDARSSQPPPPKGLSPAGSFGKKMTMDELILLLVRRISSLKVPWRYDAALVRDRRFRLASRLVREVLLSPGRHRLLRYLSKRRHRIGLPVLFTTFLRRYPTLLSVSPPPEPVVSPSPMHRRCLGPADSQSAANPHSAADEIHG